MCFFSGEMYLLSYAADSDRGKRRKAEETEEEEEKKQKEEGRGWTVISSISTDAGENGRCSLRSSCNHDHHLPQ